MTQFSDIFKYAHYAHDDCGNTIYDICVLMKDVGDYEEGYEFYTIIFIPTNGTLEFYESIWSDPPIMVKKLE
jgi:hypothetical protein